MRPLAILLLLPISALAAPLSEPETSALVARIAASRSGRTVQADFVETKTLPLWKNPIIESGTMAFEPPDRFLRKSNNLILCDGETLWMYYPEFQQVERYPLSSRGPGEIFAALGQALRFEDLQKVFRVSAEALPDGFRITLTPGSGRLRQMIERLTLELDASLRLRSSSLSTRRGDRIETHYSNEKLLAPGSVDFTFQPPASATVVAPLGGR